MRILVVEDQPEMNALLVKQLKAAGYSVDSCLTGTDALDYMAGGEYDAMVLDIMLPGVDGLEVLRRRRAAGDKTPVLLLTARDGIEDRVRGLDSGADDYLVKPFALQELLARLRVLIRRRADQVSDVITVGDLQVDCIARRASRGGQGIALSAKEFAVLEYLARNAGVVLSRERISQGVWNYDYEGGSNVVDVYIRYLRKKNRRRPRTQTHPHRARCGLRLAGGSMNRLSITMRVTLLYTLFMVLLTGLSLGFLFHAGAQSRRQTTLDRMQTMAEASRKELEAKDGELEIDRDLEAFDDGVYLSLYDTAGVPLYGFVPREFDNSVIFDDGSLRTVESGGHSWYLYDEQITVEDYGPVWVRSIAAADAFDSTLGTLGKTALLVLPVFVVLAAVCGYLLTRRAFAPVRQITQTAREIGEGGDLSRRIGLTGRKDEIHTLAAEFDAMFARLEQAFDREKQFTDDASHELRTPTAVILSQSEYALQNTHPQGETRAALESIHTQAARMAALLSQLLMLARADKGRQVVQREPVDLSELVEMVAETEAEQAEARNITVQTELEPGVMVQGDETLLMRLLINLTENAIRYGRPGGQVKLTLRRQDGEAVGTVEDDGIGIAPEDLDKIWQRFWQADPARSGGGAGLGLSMVRWIAGAHGGRVTVQSEPGKGSIFTFFLPCEKNENV